MIARDLNGQMAVAVIERGIDALVKRQRLVVNADLLEDLVKRDRAVVVDVDAHVVGVAQVRGPLIVLGVVVNVPVEMDEAILVVAAPEHQGVVAEHETAVAADADGRERVHRVEDVAKEIAVTGDLMIVVPEDEMLVSGQSLKERVHLLDGQAQREVTQNIDVVGVPDGVVPVLDQTLVHLLHGSERPVAGLDDLGVTKMQI